MDVRLEPQPAQTESLRYKLRPTSRIAPLLATNRRSAIIAAIVGASIVLAVAIPLNAALNIWIDEAFALHSTGAGLVSAWHEAIVFEAQPPLYFMIEALWRTLNEGSIAFARFPSALFAAAAVAVVVGAAHRLTPRIPPIIVALLTAGNPTTIWAATEMRVYALVFFAGAVLTWAFFSGYLVRRRSRRAQCIYVVAAIAVLYTQYYAGFFLLAHAITLLVMRRPAMRAFAGTMAIITAAFTPFAGIVARHVTSSGGFVVHVSMLKAIHDVVDYVVMYIAPHDLSWSGTLKVGSIVAAALLLVLIAYGRPVISDVASRAVVVQWVVCVATFIVVFLVAGMPYSLRRHIIIIAPVSLLVALIVTASLSRRRVLIGSIACATLAVFTTLTLGTIYRPPLGKPGDWQRVAATLASSPVAPIAVFPAEFALALAAYLPLPSIPIPEPMPFTYDYVALTALRAQSQVATELDPVRAHHERLWLVSADVCGNDHPIFNYHCGYLQEYLHDRYRLEKTVHFNGSTAQLYRRVVRSSQAHTVRTASAFGSRTRSALARQRPR